MSTKKLSTKLCRQNEFDQIRCRPISCRRSVYRQNVCRQNTLSTNDMQFDCPFHRLHFVPFPRTNWIKTEDCISNRFIDKISSWDYRERRMLMSPRLNLLVNFNFVSVETNRQEKSLMSIVVNVALFFHLSIEKFLWRIQYLLLSWTIRFLHHRRSFSSISEPAAARNGKSMGRVNILKNWRQFEKTLFEVQMTQILI